MLQRKSITTNGIISGISKVIELIIPLIAYPYIFRVLGPESYGRVSYATSLVSYFTLFATLGVFSYAQRECSVVRDNQELLNRKVSQIFTISILLMSLSLSVYLVCVFSISSLREDFPLFLIFSISIINSSLIMDWIYKVFERFDLVSYRTILAKVFYLILCLTLVKSHKDYYVYAIIFVFTSSVIQTIINQYGIISGKVGIRLSLCPIKEILPCISPIFYLGLMTIGSKLFSSSDVLLVKWLIGADSNKAVGLYSSAILLPETIEGVLMTIAAVVSPQIYMLIGKKDEERTKSLMNRTSNAMFMIVIPAIITFFFFSEEIMYIVAGEEFMDSGPIVRIYSLVLLTAFAITLAGTRTYIARGKEKKLFVILFLAALFNIVLDIIFISHWGLIGGAIATVISNVILMSVELSLEHTWHYIFTTDKLKFIVGGVIIFTTFLIVKLFHLDNAYFRLFVSIATAAPFYVFVLFVLRESTICLLWDKVKISIRRIL